MDLPIFGYCGNNYTVSRDHRIKCLGNSIVGAVGRQIFNNDKEEETCQLQFPPEFNFHK